MRRTVSLDWFHSVVTTSKHEISNHETGTIVWLSDPMGGQPSIRGLRIPVTTVVAMVADGMTVGEILADIPELETEDVAEALRYAAEPMQ